MAKISKNQKELVHKNYDFLIEEVSKLAREKGLTDIRFDGFIIKPSDHINETLNCPCGVETYIHPVTGKVSKRCKRCPDL